MYLGMTFERAVESFGWGEVINFSRNLPIGSMTVRSKNKEIIEFASDLKRNAILADLYDLVSAFLYTFARAHGSKSGRPKPYKRPWLSPDEQHIGKGAIPISEFNEWYYGGE